MTKISLPNDDLCPVCDTTLLKHNNLYVNYSKNNIEDFVYVNSKCSSVVKCITTNFGYDWFDSHYFQYTHCDIVIINSIIYNIDYMNYQIYLNVLYDATLIEVDYNKSKKENLEKFIKLKVFF